MPNRTYRLPATALAVLCASWPTTATAGTTPVPEPIDALLEHRAAEKSGRRDYSVIRNNDAAFVCWIDDGDVARSLTTKPQRVLLPQQRQGEGVTFTPDGHSLLINSEGVGQPISQIPLPRAVDTERIAVSPAGQVATKDESTMIAMALAGSGPLVAILLIGCDIRRHS
jgi:hypothetical protein